MDPLYSLFKYIWPVNTGYSLTRIGHYGDGGYLVPDCLSGIEVCISPGTAKDILAETQLAERYGIQSLMCDPDHDAPEGLGPLLHFEKIKIAAHTEIGISISMMDLLDKYNMKTSCPILLSMDIEGGEYEVIQSIPDRILSSMRIITLEIHYLTDSRYIQLANKLFEKLWPHFDLVHMRPNNACKTQIQIGGQMLPYYHAIEVTFLAKMMRKWPPQPISLESLPHKLDSLNVTEYGEVEYDFFRYMASWHERSENTTTSDSLG